nr:YjhX family toxin [Marinicella sp. W31]MDC2877689.1 YjhX family toxin [Marinicella sp. W31]
MRHDGANPDFKTMDISRNEQRILHLLAQGGRIELTRSDNRKIEQVDCYTRDGWVYPGLDLTLFRKLKAKRAIRSRGGRPYQITERGLKLVRSQPDNK